MSINKELLFRLVYDEFSTRGTHRDGSNKASSLICPLCGKAEAFVNFEEGFDLICSRLNKCGEHTNLVKYYQDEDIFIDTTPPLRKVSKEADLEEYLDAFLEQRSLTRSVLVGVRYKLERKQSKRGKHVYLGLPLSNGVYWWRNIETKGTLFDTGSSWRGAFLDARQLVNGETLFVVESPLDALSLKMLGLPAVSYVSAGATIPEDFFQTQAESFSRIVLMADNDDAGYSFLNRNKHRPRNLSVSLLKKGEDVNDLVIKGLKKEEVLSEIELGLSRGVIYSGITLNEYFHQYIAPEPSIDFFEFRGWTYAVKRTNKTDTFFAIFNSLLEVTRDVFDAEGNRYSMLFSKGKEFALTGKSFSSASSFMELLFTNGVEVLNKNFDIPEYIQFLRGKNPPVVTKGIESWGGDYEGRFVLGDRIYINKKVHYLKNDAFCIGDSQYIPPTDDTLQFRIEDSSAEQEHSVDEVLSKFFALFGEDGASMLSFYVANIFFPFLMRRNGSFPFLAITGEPNSGKSTLTKIVNRFMGFRSEGFSADSFTLSGFNNKTQTLAGLPFPLLEANTKTQNKGLNRILSEDSLKPLYNGNSFYTKNAGRTSMLGSEVTKTYKLNCSLVFVMNTNPIKDLAVKQRIISLLLDKQHKDKKVADLKAKKSWIELLTSMKVGAVVDRVLTSTLDLEDLYTRSRASTNRISDPRLQDNLSILFFGYNVLKRCFAGAPIPDIVARTIEQQNEIQQANRHSSLAWLVESLREPKYSYAPYELAMTYGDIDSLRLYLKRYNIETDDVLNELRNNGVLLREEVIDGIRHYYIKKWWLN